MTRCPRPRRRCSRTGSPASAPTTAPAPAAAPAPGPSASGGARRQQEGSRPGGQGPQAVRRQVQPPATRRAAARSCWSATCRACRATSRRASGKRLVVPGDPESSYLVRQAGARPRGHQGRRHADGRRPAERQGGWSWCAQWIVAHGEPKRGRGGRDPAPSGAAAEPERAQARRGPADAGGDDKPAEKERGKPPFHGTFQINLPTTTTLGRRTFEFRIDHRFGQVGAERGAFGLDAGANIPAYGFAYGILNGWDVLIRRTNLAQGLRARHQVHPDPPGGRQEAELRRLRVGRVPARLPEQHRQPVGRQLPAAAQPAVVRPAGARS